jgi:hypothetical protein
MGGPEANGDCLGQPPVGARVSLGAGDRHEHHVGPAHRPRELGHEGLLLLRHVFDGGIESSLSRRLRQLQIALE